LESMAEECSKDPTRLSDNIPDDCLVNSADYTSREEVCYSRATHLIFLRGRNS